MCALRLQSTVLATFIDGISTYKMERKLYRFNVEIEIRINRVLVYHATLRAMRASQSMCTRGWPLRLQIRRRSTQTRKKMDKWETEKEKEGESKIKCENRLRYSIIQSVATATMAMAQWWKSSCFMLAIFGRFYYNNSHLRSKYELRRSSYRKWQCFWHCIRHCID